MKKVKLQGKCSSKSELDDTIRVQRSIDSRIEAITILRQFYLENDVRQREDEHYLAGGTTTGRELSPLIRNDSTTIFAKMNASIAVAESRHKKRGN